MIRFPCAICSKPVNDNHKAICCDYCQSWVHLRCNKLNDTDYTYLKNSPEKWFCINCNSDIFPFNKQTDDMSSESTKIKLIPPANLVSLFNEFNNLTSSKKTNDTSIDCGYRDIDILKNIQRNKGSLALFHLNIASLCKNFDDFHQFLKETEFDFDVIGIKLN